MKAILLAAGRGTRLGKLTESLPKPMLRVAGKPVLEWNVEWLAKHGFQDIAINLHHAAGVVRNHFGSGSAWGVRIHYSYEPVLLGTAGAVKNLQGWLGDEPFVVWYGDNISTVNLTALMEANRDNRADVTIATVLREDGRNSGVVLREERDWARITAFIEKPVTPLSGSMVEVSTGIFVLNPNILWCIPEGRSADFGLHIFPSLARTERVYSYELEDPEGLWWIDTPEDLERTRVEFASYMLI